jgi:hypothetical protein
MKAKLVPNILDRYTYRWGFVFRVKNDAADFVHKVNTPTPPMKVVYYDKSFIASLKAATQFQRSQ